MGAERTGGCWHFLVPDNDGIFPDLTLKDVRDMSRGFTIISKVDLTALQKAAASKLFKPGVTPGH